MDIDILEKNNNIEQNNYLINEVEQNNFLDTTLGKAINTAIDIGLKAVLPDFVDEQIINIKDNLINYGLKEGISKTIEDSIDLGKSTIGIITGNFESVQQMQNAVRAGGLIDGVSSLLDEIVDKVNQAGYINNKVAKTIKQGKNVIINSVENNIKKTFKDQYQAINYIEKYINSWKNYFENKNFEGMEKEYIKLEKQLKNIAPIEKIINEAKTIEMLHNIIKNNEKDFNLSIEQLELVNKLK